jgi:hypothetical protein
MTLPPALHVVTPCSRPGNLPHVAESLKLLDGFRVAWHVVYSQGGTLGGPERNEGIEAVTDPDAWVYFLDDDNAIHPDLSRSLLRAVKEHPAAVGFVFGQERADQPMPANVFPGPAEIDTAQFVFRRSAIGNVRWDDNGRLGDYRFFKSIRAADPGDVIAIPESVTYWNALNGTVPT